MTICMNAITAKTQEQYQKQNGRAKTIAMRSKYVVNVERRNNMKKLEPQLYIDLRGLPDDITIPMKIALTQYWIKLMEYREKYPLKNTSKEKLPILKNPGNRMRTKSGKVRRFRMIKLGRKGKGIKKKKKND